MDVKIKAAIVSAPFLLAAYVGFCLLQPALDDIGKKDTARSEKNTENTTFQSKLKGSTTVAQKEAKIRKEIEQLRGAVPKSADIELLTIDLEKMCKDAGMNMIALTAPGKESTHPKPAEEGASSKKDKPKVLSQPAPSSGKAVINSPATEAKELQKTSKQFIVTGDYDGLQKLIYELETYQRVIRIEDISFHLPGKAGDKVKIEDSGPGEGDEGGDPNQMFTTMTLTTYFLP